MILHMFQVIGNAYDIHKKLEPRFNLINVHFVCVEPGFNLIPRYNTDEMHIYYAKPRFNPSMK